MPSHPSLPRVLTPQTAAALGLTRSAIRHAVDRGRWLQLPRGIVVTSDRVARTDWALAGLAWAGASGAISGWDAIRLNGLGSRHPPTAEVLVLARSGNHRRIGAVRIRPTVRAYDSWRVPAWDPDLPDAAVASTSRAIADAALECRRLADVRAMVTTAIQRNLVHAPDLVRELDEGPRNDSGLLRIAVADVLDNVHSVAEAEAVDQLKASRVPAFEANVPIVTADGEVLGVADVLWRELRAVLEVDSREFHFRELDWKSTSKRHNRLTAHGFALAHYAPSTIADTTSGWIQEVERWLAARARELGKAYDPAGGLQRPAGGRVLPLVVPALR